MGRIAEAGGSAAGTACGGGAPARGTAPHPLEHPAALTDPDLLPGLVLDLTRIWVPTLL